MVIAILLLVILFIAGLININLYLPSKKLYAYLESLFIRTDYTSKVSHQESTGGTGSFDSDGQKRSQLKSVFAMFDKNGDGYITKQELRDSLKNMRIIMSEKEVDEMVVKVDSNGDGLIDFDEFCVLCESISTGPEDGGLDGMEEDELKEAFDVFDKDKDGLISVEELSLVLSCLGMKEGKSEEDCKEMIRKVDLDGDGMVNFDEFKKMMRNGTKVF